MVGDTRVNSRLTRGMAEVNLFGTMEERMMGYGWMENSMVKEYYQLQMEAARNEALGKMART